jgi:predicted transcriptional regulator
MTEIEWPTPEALEISSAFWRDLGWDGPRSAVYNEDELGLVRELLRRCDQGELGRAEVVQQVNVMHAFKAGMDASMIDEPEQPEAEPEEEPEPLVLCREGTQRRRVLDTLYFRRKAEEGVGEDELAKECKLRPPQISLALSVLEAQGWVEDTGKRRMPQARARGKSRQGITLWKMSERGLEAYPGFEEHDKQTRRRTARRKA